MTQNPSRERLIRQIEMHRCPNSTDGGGRESRHYVKDGGCVICDRGIDSLAWHYGLA